VHGVLPFTGGYITPYVQTNRSHLPQRKKFATVAGPDAHEPWWVATSESGSAKHALALYDRRMTVEEQFRDTKCRRFGAKLSWTQFRDPGALARFVTLLAVALLIWTLAGIVAAEIDPSLRLRSRRKGPRHSFVAIGTRAVIQNTAPRLAGRT
jgi:hypothetical protein